MSRKCLACALIESDGMVQQELREATRCQPRHAAAAVFHASEREAPVSVESVPAQHCRFGCGASHGLDRIPHDLANTPDLEHGRHYTLRHGKSAQWIIFVIYSPPTTRLSAGETTKSAAGSLNN